MRIASILARQPRWYSLLIPLLLTTAILPGCAMQPGVNSNGTPTTAAQQVAGDAYVAYDVADVAWLAYLRSGRATIAVIQVVEPRRREARIALDNFATAAISGNAAAARSAFNSALAAWQAEMTKANIPQ